MAHLNREGRCDEIKVIRQGIHNRKFLPHLKAWHHCSHCLPSWQPGIPPLLSRYLGHVGEPLEDGVDAFEVIRDGHVGDTVVVHDLHSAQLVVRGVDFPAQDLPRRRTKRPIKAALSSKTPSAAS